MNKALICECCGKRYAKDLDGDVYLGNNCFDCSFWLKKISMLEEDEARRVVVKGEHYMMAPEDGYGFKGFGGRCFHIRFFDGRVVASSNLWYQGTISKRFRALLPDNAVFVWDETAVSTVIDSEIPF